jgi:hypothetical protein
VSAPVLIVKIVYAKESFTKEEEDRGAGNLTRYLYFYEKHSKEYIEDQILKATRPGVKIFYSYCNI